jgi:hypothetical protein
MTVEYLRDAQRKQPFLPFHIHMADGKSVFVPHPDFISIGPVGRLVFVHTETGGVHVLDRMLMTAIEYPRSSNAA